MKVRGLCLFWKAVPRREKPLIADRAAVVRSRKFRAHSPKARKISACGRGYNDRRIAKGKAAPVGSAAKKCRGMKTFGQTKIAKTPVCGGNGRGSYHKGGGAKEIAKTVAAKELARGAGGVR